jgi:hypothetical protein
MEAFFSDSTLEAADAATAASAGPVRAESLIPISRAEAASRETFNGSTLPGHPVTRRVIPRPFQRTRVVGGRHGKKWQERTLIGVRPGDIVPDVGRVVDVSEAVRYRDRNEFIDGAEPGNIAVGLDIVLTGAGGSELRGPASQSIRVFRLAPAGGSHVLPHCYRAFRNG